MPSGVAGKAQSAAIAVAIARICNAACGFGGMESISVFIVAIH
jgi:hypothetical protein